MVVDPAKIVTLIPATLAGKHSPRVVKAEHKVEVELEFGNSLQRMRVLELDTAISINLLKFLRTLSEHRNCVLDE